MGGGTLGFIGSDDVVVTGPCSVTLGPDGPGWERVPTKDPFLRWSTEVDVPTVRGVPLPVPGSRTLPT